MTVTMISTATMDNAFILLNILDKKKFHSN